MNIIPIFNFLRKPIFLVSAAICLSLVLGLWVRDRRIEKEREATLLSQAWASVNGLMPLYEGALHKPMPVNALNKTAEAQFQMQNLANNPIDSLVITDGREINIAVDNLGVAYIARGPNTIALPLTNKIWRTLQPNRYLSLSHLADSDQSISPGEWKQVAKSTPNEPTVTVVRSLCVAKVPVSIMEFGGVAGVSNTSDACPSVTGKPSSLVEWVDGYSPKATVVGSPTTVQASLDVQSAKNLTAAQVLNACKISSDFPAVFFALDGVNVDEITVRDCGILSQFVAVNQKHLNRVCVIDLRGSEISSITPSPSGIQISAGYRSFDWSVALSEKDGKLSAVSKGGDVSLIACADQ